MTSPHGEWVLIVILVLALWGAVFAIGAMISDRDYDDGPCIQMGHHPDCIDDMARWADNCKCLGEDHG